MAENLGTNTSAIGDPLPQSGVYRGYNVHVMLAGVKIGRAQEMTFTVDNNMTPYYELGSRNPLYTEGNFDCRGTLRRFILDSLMLKLAMGNDRDVVGASDFLDTIGPTTDLTTDLTPEFGSQPWYRLYKFTITCELHQDGSDRYLEYRLMDCQLDTYRFSATQDGEAIENMAFVSPRVGVRAIESST